MKLRDLDNGRGATSPSFFHGDSLGAICKSNSRKQTLQRVEYAQKLAGQSLRNSLVQRKVRAPQSRMPVNDRTPRGDGKCHRE